MKTTKSTRPKDVEGNIFEKIINLKMPFSILTVITASINIFNFEYQTYTGPNLDWYGSEPYQHIASVIQNVLNFEKT